MREKGCLLNSRYQFQFDCTKLYHFIFKQMQFYSWFTQEQKLSFISQLLDNSEIRTIYIN